MIKELANEKAFKNRSHFKLLLEKTATYRRKFAKEAQNTEEIITKFPHLRNATLVSLLTNYTIAFVTKREID